MKEEKKKDSQAKPTIKNLNLCGIAVSDIILATQP
jgi:hypothetical protein